MTSPSFIHLHVHSEHSLLAGVPSVAQLVRSARERGYKSLALTDTHTTAGLIHFLEECRCQQIHPILGLELHEPDDPTRRLVLLARDAHGYGDLCELVTAHLEERARLPQRFVQEWPHLFALCPHPGLLAELAATPLRPVLYGELLCNDATTRAVSRQVEAVALALELPLVAAADVFFLDRRDYDGHRLLRAIDANTSLSRLAEDACASPGSWLRPPAQMGALFARLPQAITNAAHIAAACRDELQPTPWILPTIAVPAGHTPDSWLAELAWEGLRTNYPAELQPQRERAETIQRKELDTIARTGYASYFLMVREVRRWAGTTFGAGYRGGRESSIMRGSAANCMTFYNLGASDLDPIRHDLYFERFLNEDRTSPPDADLDFAWDEREQVRQWFFDTWGQERVCILCTTNRFRSRAAFREAAKALGYSESQVSQIMGNLRHRPQHITPTPGTHWLDQLPPDDRDLQRIGAWARFLRGRPHFLGQHPGGILVTDDPIWRHVGCQRSGGATNRIISQIDMHSGIDFLGLVKFDILGNGSLAVLRDALAQLREQGESDPRMHDLEPILTDPPTCELLRGGGSLGVFYLESPAQMRLNRKARAGNFEEIGITSSLIRPAGTAWVDEFVRRRRAWQEGRSSSKPLPTVLEPILGRTHGILVFQEDVTRVCVEVAGLSFAQADRVRKMMNSAHEGEPANYQETARLFVEGCVQRGGLSLTQARELWRRVDSFRGFSFCKSHSLSYAQLSFRCAWLKAHYPAQFIAAVISNGHGYYNPSLYIDEARRMGLQLVGFHINRCRREFLGTGSTLTPGLQHIRRISAASTHALLEERSRNGPFGSLESCVQRVANLRPKEWESLVLVGCFDFCQPNRVQALAQMRELLRNPALRKDRLRQQSVLSLAEPQQSPRASLYGLPELSDYTLLQKCEIERKLLGYSVSGNLLDLLTLHPAQRGAVHPADLPKLAGRRVRLFGLPMVRRLHRASNGELMLFLSVQDSRGIIDCIFWPDTYRTYAHQLEDDAPMELWGTVNEDQDTYSVVVNRVRLSRFKHFAEASAIAP